MNHRHVTEFIALFGLIACSMACAAEEQFPPAGELPQIKQLPDPFLFPDGSRVKSAADWSRRREQIKSQLLYYEFGRMAPPPGNVKGTEVSSKSEDSGATAKEIRLTMGPDEKVRAHLFLTIPPGKGPFATIIKGDLCWGRIKPEIVSEVIKHDYILAEFDRTDFAPDSKDRSKGVFVAYPNEDWGDLGAWAWGFSRCVDYLITRDDVDVKQIVVTGHSRGGKAALLAGATDERVALTVPNGSGCGGAGCYRVNPPKTETLAIITDHFPNWFTPRFKEFVEKVDRLPFDHHELKALVAPRALLSTDALGDVWANPTGTEQTYLAAKVVFDFLGAGDKIGIHFREGGHDQNGEDFAALLDFADHLFVKLPLKQRYDQIPVPTGDLDFDWKAPTKE